MTDCLSLKKFSLILVTFLLCCMQFSALNAQQVNQVKGLVKDENGLPIAGVSIIAKNNKTNFMAGTTSDSLGIFHFIKLPSVGQYSFTISCVGFETQILSGFNISVNDNTTILVKLKPAIKDLAEVVAVGYSTQRKKDISTSVSSVKAEDIVNQPVLNFDQALVGKMSGVQIIQNTGKPNASTDIRVRGTGTITAGVNPLYVVDGVPLGSGQAFEEVEMNDIESINVLKDASAAAIYGSRGSNGVVLITTKKGKEGKLKVNYSGIYGIQQLAKEIPMMNAYQYAQLSYEAHNNAYVGDGASASNNYNPQWSDPASIRHNSWDKIPPDLYPYIGLNADGTPSNNITSGLNSTDWQKAIYQTAPMIKQTISLSGGNKNSTYYISGNYETQKGIIINSDYTRYAARLNYTVRAGKVKIGLNFTPSFSTEHRVNSDDYYGNYGVVQSALAMCPVWTVYNPDGSFNYDGNGKWRVGTDYQHNEVINPVAIATLFKNKINHANLFSNFSFDWEILNGLHYKLNVGATFNQYTNDQYWPSSLPLIGSKYWAAGSYIPTVPTGYNSNTTYFDWLIENTLNYSKKINRHNIVALVGLTAQKDTKESSNFSTTGATNDAVSNAGATNISGSSTSQIGATPGYDDQQWALASLLGRIQYNYAEKYFVTGSIRTDGSSRFGENNRWGYFPSASAAWLISSENFMKKISWLSLLKLRASYGVSGNFNIGNYGQAELLGNTTAVLGQTQALVIGTSPTQYGNNNLTWEKTKMTNIGLDAYFFNSRIGLELDVYNGNTYNSLLNLPIPTITGYSTSLQNIGQVNNKGLELSLIGKNSFGKFTWNARYNISFNKNEVKALGMQNAPIIKSAGTATAYWITKVGQSIGSYYLLKYDGIFKDQTELNSYPHFSTTQVGDFKFIDVDKNGSIDVNLDRDVVGSYFPKFTYSFSNEFSYNGFDLSIAFQGVYGNKILNLSRRYIANGEGNINNTTEMLNRYVSSSQPGNGLVNRANRKATGNNSTISTWHLEDASYLRLQNLVLGYSLPQSLIQKIKIQRLRLYVSAQNLITFTKYTGYNPEVNMSNGDQLTPGLDYGVYPLAKTYSVGLNLEF